MLEILIGISEHDLDIVVLDILLPVCQPFQGIPAVLAVFLRGLTARPAFVYTLRISRRTEHALIILYVLVRESHLRGQSLHDVQPGRCIPVEIPDIMILFLGIYGFHWIVRCLLSEKIEIFGRIVRIMHRSGRIRLYRIEEYILVRIHGLDYSRGNVCTECEKSAFGGMIDRSPGSVFFPFRPPVNAGGAAVVRTDAVIASAVAS